MKLHMLLVYVREALLHCNIWHQNDLEAIEHNRSQSLIVIFITRSFLLQKGGQAIKSGSFWENWVIAFNWISIWSCAIHEFHETCHSVTVYFMKQDSKRCCDTTTPKSIHTKDESKRGSAFAFIFGVN